MASVSYSSYLQLDPLLKLQKRLSKPPAHDEMLFIVIHQVYELWFKQLLHEATLLQAAFEGGDAPQSMQTLGRMCTILKTLVGQVDILETMTPAAFNAFRDELQTSSGFQSHQFRLLEFVLGKRNPQVLRQYEPGSQPHAALQHQLTRPALYDSFLRFLDNAGCDMPPQARRPDFGGSIAPSEEVQKALTRVYHTRPELAQICERLVDLDEGFGEWRYRHVQLVQRTIGIKTGTGGSAGSEYLKRTLFEPFFADLWAIRSML